MSSGELAEARKRKPVQSKIPNQSTSSPALGIRSKPIESKLNPTKITPSQSSSVSSCQLETDDMRPTTLGGDEMIYSDDDLESIDGRLVREVEKEHQFGRSHWLPLTFALLPTVGSMIMGEPDSWTDLMTFLLVAYFLYKISKAPWDLYASARTTRILTYTRAEAVAQRKSKHTLSSPKIVYPSTNQPHEHYTTELKRNELVFLFLAIVSPAFGVGLLLFLQSRWKLGLEYLNSNSTVLFLMSSLIRPVSHLHEILQQRARFLQNQIRYPTQVAEELNDTVERLMISIETLERSAVSKQELNSLKRNHLDAPLSQLSKKLSKHQRSDELAQLKSAKKLHQLEEILSKLNEKLQSTQVSLQELSREEQSLRNSPVHTLGNMIFQLLQATESQERSTTGLLQNASSSSEENQRFTEDLEHSDSELVDGKFEDDHLHRTKNKSDRTASNQPLNHQEKSRNFPQQPIMNLETFFQSTQIVLQTWMKIFQDFLWFSISPLKILKLMIEGIHKKFYEETNYPVMDRYQRLSDYNLRTDREHQQLKNSIIQQNVHNSKDHERILFGNDQQRRKKGGSLYQSDWTQTRHYRHLDQKEPVTEI